MVALRLTKLGIFLVVAVLMGSFYLGVASAVQRSFAADGADARPPRNRQLEEAVRKASWGQDLDEPGPGELPRRP